MSSKVLGISIDKEDLLLTEVLRGFRGPSYTSWRINGFMTKPYEHLQKGAKRQKFPYKEVILAWPRERTIIREVTLSYTDLRELKEALKYQLDSFLPVKGENVYFDLYPGAEGRIFLIAVKKEELNDLLERLAAIEIVPSSVIIAPMAFVPFQRARDEKLALVKHVGAYSYTLLEGAKLSKTLFLEDEGAVFKILNLDRPERIMLDVKNKEASSPLLISQEGRNVTFVEDYYEPLGAAIFCASKSFPKFNLLGSGKRSVKGALLLCSLLAAFIMAFSVFIPLILKKKAADKLATLEAKIAQLKPDVTKVENIQKYLESHNSSLNKVNELMRNYAPRLATIEDLTKHLPKDAWIKELSLSRDTITIEGFASAATDLVPALDRSPLFSDVTLISPITKDRSGKERLRIKATIHQER